MFSLRTPADLRAGLVPARIADPAGALAWQAPPPTVETLEAATTPTRPPAPVTDGADRNTSFATATQRPLDDGAGVGDPRHRPDDIDTCVVARTDRCVVEVTVAGTLLGSPEALDLKVELRDEAGALLAEDTVDPLQSKLVGDPRAVVQFGPGRLRVEVRGLQGPGDGSVGDTAFRSTVTRGFGDDLALELVGVTAETVNRCTLPDHDSGRRGLPAGATAVRGHPARAAPAPRVARDPDGSLKRAREQRPPFPLTRSSS